MVKADLHVHSKFSAHPSEWFLQKIGTRESYTEPQDLYDRTRSEGMDFTTITDHNCICASMQLAEKYPDKAFTGVEVTTYFPEDGCKIHVPVWGLTRAQFDKIDTIRTNIYSFRDYLREQNLAHSVAHATFSVNKMLRLEHLEKLILLFDHFETINGTRTESSNRILHQTLENLTEETIYNLQQKYNIEPFSKESWIKGYSGGSDDHSGLFIARTWTELDAPCNTPEEFLQAFRLKKGRAAGRNNDYRGFAISLYKIAYDFSRQGKSPISKNIMGLINGLLFNGKGQSLTDELKIKTLSLSMGKKEDSTDLSQMVKLLIKDLSDNRDSTIAEKGDTIYDHAAAISDSILSNFVRDIAKSLRKGDIGALVRNISGSIPALFISAPFFTTSLILNNSRTIQEELREKYLPKSHNENKKTLWFTDTLTDLNGVSETIKKVATIAYKEERTLSIITAGHNTGIIPLPENVLYLDTIFSYTPDFFETYTTHIPSILKSIKKISKLQPDKIVISTPGPVGLLGLLCSWLLNIPATGIYHTDFSEYSRILTKDEGISMLVQEYIKWFYQRCEKVYVPTNEYINILDERGYDIRKLSPLRRGIDHALFTPERRSKKKLKALYAVEDGYNFLYSGRISHEKNISYMLEVFEEVLKEEEECNLILCGNGPAYDELSRKYASNKRVHFTGRLPREELATLYASSDLFLFPSLTDTFGMSVLEAQSCGLPALVTTYGGPKEIVRDGETGYVVSPDTPHEWKRFMLRHIADCRKNKESIHKMRLASRELVLTNFNWYNTIEDIMN